MKLFLLATLFATQTHAASPRPFSPMDVFNLEWASSPNIAPDGKKIMFVRNSLDVMHDQRRSALWIMDRAGKNLEPLTQSENNASAPQFSPNGTRVAYLSQGQIFIRFLTSGRELQLTHEQHNIEQFAFAPDGKSLAFSMRVSATQLKPAELPIAPVGAQWAAPVSVIDRLVYRSDGEGIFEANFTHIFTVPAHGGSARQVSSGDFNYSSFAYADSQTLIVSANREPDAEYQPLQNDLFELDLSDADQTLEPKRLTTRVGPDEEPSVSADGRYIAYVGFTDANQFYQVRALSVLDRKTGVSTVLTTALDRDVVAPSFDASGDTIYFQFDDQGRSKIGAIARSGGAVRTLAADLGGADIGRPYGVGSMVVGRGGDVVYTRGSAQRPSEIGLIAKRKIATLTDLNSDALSAVDVQPVAEIQTKSSFDGLAIQAWVMYPPGFDATKKYPLLLEIHGGPVANYGPRFGAETQAYAAHGYIVVYANPRGSSSYGEKFGNLINHDYPNHDFDDLMSITDAVIAKGHVDTRNLFVTGGSGGGVLTAWIVGHTDRFRAAVVAKPVINWISFVLTSDATSLYSRYWFPGTPWEQAENYLKRSPLMSVGQVTTPTMVICGEADSRTPISEAEQFFTALKMRKVATQMVRIPGASHTINARPSNLLAQVANTVAWFERFRVH